jgi:hypothetical protein
MTIALYVVAALAIIAALYRKVAREDEQLEGWDIVETRLPRVFGRLDKERAMDVVNRFYR